MFRAQAVVRDFAYVDDRPFTIRQSRHRLVTIFCVFC
jgi:hypothetical protein